MICLARWLHVGRMSLHVWIGVGALAPVLSLALDLHAPALSCG
jgi:hypothetical protein